MWIVFTLTGWLLLGVANDEHAEVSFDRDIVPLLTKAGCNAGSCHGAAAGRGDFQLSLLGSNAAADHHAIVAAYRGRRIHRLQPTRSLFLRKPTGELEHGGGQVLEFDGPEIATIARWIEKGAQHHVSSRLDRLTVTPEQAHFASVPATTSIRAEATFADGTTRVVSNYVTVTTPDAAAIRLEPSGAIQLLRPGEHVILVRYMDQVVPVRLCSPLGAVPLHHAWRTAENLVDQEILQKLESLRLPVSPPADDAEWLRRVSLDLTGRLPEPDTAREYLRTVDNKNRSSLRAVIVEQLLTGPEFADYWTWRFAADLRMRSYPNERQPLDAYYQWLRQSIEDDLGFDRIAEALLTTDGDSHEIGPANFGRVVRDAREQAELVGQFFAGARLGCANCHDHPLDRWTQDDYHGLAAVFARVQRTRHVGLAPRGEVTNTRTGQPAIPRIPGERDLSLAGDHRHEVVQWVLDEQHDLLARVMVNRLWRALFGRGLVEPVDDLRVTNPATHPELLARLARDFAAHGFRLRHTLRLLALSESYARSKEVLPGNRDDDRYYSRAFPRPLEPAILVDAIQDVLRVAEAFPGNGSHRAIRLVDSTQSVRTLDALGRCQVGQSCAGSEEGAFHLSAQLHLLNGDVINQKLGAPDGRLQRQWSNGLPIERIVQEWYWAALSRPATEGELEKWANELAAPSGEEQRERVEDFVWSLLNSRAFVER
jgi:hypothetical protein